ARGRCGRDSCTAVRRLFRFTRARSSSSPEEALVMLDRFLDSADAAQVMELMRQAELSSLQITEALQWSEDASTWSVVLLVPPARLVFRRHDDGAPADHTPTAVPRSLADQLVARLQGKTLWRSVRKQLEDRFS